MILADTSVWVDFLQGEDSPQRHMLHRLIEDEEDVCITEIILTEVLQGIKDDKEFRKVKSYLLEFPVYSPKGVETYVEAASIYRDCRRKGKTVRKTVDGIIAAICIEHGLVLLHKDSDFTLIEKCGVLNCLDAG
jgi:predicted nucleic acid-binding protein